MHPQNFMIFVTYKLHNAENEMMLSLCHYVNSYSPDGATNMSTFYLHYSSFTFSYFYIETVHYFWIYLEKQKFIWFCCLVVFISTLLFCK